MAETEEETVRAEGVEPSRALRPYGFSYHFGFRRRHRRSWSGLSLHLLRIARVRRCPSSLYTFPQAVRPGLARDRHLQGSPNLSSSASPVSRRALKFSSSPLRLPVPPRPRSRSSAADHDRATAGVRLPHFSQRRFIRPRLPFLPATSDSPVDGGPRSIVIQPKQFHDRSHVVLSADTEAHPPRFGEYVMRLRSPGGDELMAHAQRKREIR